MRHSVHLNKSQLTTMKGTISRDALFSFAEETNG